VAVGTSWAVSNLGGDSGGGSPEAQPGGGGGGSASMSDSASGTVVASSKTQDLVEILGKVDENAKNPPLIPTGTCTVPAADKVSCHPGVSGVDSVDFQLYDSLDDLYAAYMSKAGKSAGMPFEQVVNTGECDPKHFSGEVSWNHNKKHSRHYSVDQLMQDNLNVASQAAGRVFCWLHGSTLTMIWTQNDGPRFLAVAQGAPHDDVGAWWRQVHHEIACLGAGMCDDMSAMGDSPSAAPSDGMTDAPSDGMSESPTGGMTDGMG
jgi:hypothetical protein